MAVLFTVTSRPHVRRYKDADVKFSSLLIDFTIELGSDQTGWSSVSMPIHYPHKYIYDNRNFKVLRNALVNKVSDFSMIWDYHGTFSSIDGLKDHYHQVIDPGDLKKHCDVRDIYHCRTVTIDEDMVRFESVMNPNGESVECINQTSIYIGPQSNRENLILALNEVIAITDEFDTKYPRTIEVSKSQIYSFGLMQDGIELERFMLNSTDKITQALRAISYKTDFNITEPMVNTVNARLLPKDGGKETVIDIGHKSHNRMFYGGQWYVDNQLLTDAFINCLV